MALEWTAEIDPEVAAQAAAMDFAGSELSRDRPNHEVEDALVDRGMDRKEAAALVSGIRRQLDQDPSHGDSADRSSERLVEGLEFVLLAVWAIYVAFGRSGEFLGPETGDHLTDLVIGLGLLLAAWVGYRRRPWRRLLGTYSSSDSPTAS